MAKVRVKRSTTEEVVLCTEVSEERFGIGVRRYHGSLLVGQLSECSSGPMNETHVSRFELREFANALLAFCDELDEEVGR